MLISDIKKGKREKLHKVEGFEFYGYMANQLELENSSSQEGMIQIVAGDHYIEEVPADVLAIKDTLEMPVFDPLFVPEKEEKVFLVQLAKNIVEVLESDSQETMKLPESLLKDKSRAVTMLHEFYTFFFSTEDIDLLYQDALSEEISEGDYLEAIEDFTTASHNYNNVTISYELSEEAHATITKKFGPVLVPTVKFVIDRESFLLTITNENK